MRYLAGIIAAGAAWGISVAACTGSDPDAITPFSDGAPAIENTSDGSADGGASIVRCEDRKVDKSAGIFVDALNGK